MLRTSPHTHAQLRQVGARVVGRQRRAGSRAEGGKRCDAAVLPPGAAWRGGHLLPDRETGRSGGPVCKGVLSHLPIKHVLDTWTQAGKTLIGTGLWGWGSIRSWALCPAFILKPQVLLHTVKALVLSGASQGKACRVRDVCCRATACRSTFPATPQEADEIRLVRTVAAEGCRPMTR